MNVLQQPCPQCGRQLQLPSDSLGKTAKCPACDHTFTVSGMPGGDAPNPNVEPSPFSGGDAFAGAGPSAASSNPYASPEQPQGIDQPFQPSGVGPSNIVPRAVDFGEIWNEGFAVFKSRWGSYVGGFALITVISIVLNIGTNIVATAAAAGDQAAAGILGGLLGLCSGFIGNYFQLGYARACLAAARGQESPVQKNICPPFMAFLRFLGGSIIFGFIVMILVAMVALAAVAAGQADASLAGIVGVIGGLIVFGIVFYLFVSYWPFMFVIAEDRFGLMDSIRLTREVTRQNFGTSLLMLVVGFFLFLGGLIACYVGMFATVPIAYAMISVAYLMMSSQPFARATVPAAPNYPS